MREPPRKNTTHPAPSASSSASTKPTRNPATPDRTPERGRVVKSVEMLSLILQRCAGRARGRAAFDHLVIVGHAERLASVEHDARARGELRRHDRVADPGKLPRHVDVAHPERGALHETSFDPHEDRKST